MSVDSKGFTGLSRLTPLESARCRAGLRRLAPERGSFALALALSDDKVPCFDKAPLTNYKVPYGISGVLNGCARIAARG